MDICPARAKIKSLYFSPILPESLILSPDVYRVRVKSYYESGVACEHVKWTWKNRHDRVLEMNTQTVYDWEAVKRRD